METLLTSFILPVAATLCTYFIIHYAQERRTRLRRPMYTFKKIDLCGTCSNGNYVFNGVRLNSLLLQSLVQIEVSNETSFSTEKLRLNVKDIDHGWYYLDGGIRTPHVLDLDNPELGTIPPGRTLTALLLIASLVALEPRHAVLDKNGIALPMFKSKN